MPNNITKGATVFLSTVFALLAFTTSAFAGVGVGVAPDFPATVIVGQTGLPVGLEITNNSTVDVGPIDLSLIRLITSCGDTDNDTTTCVGTETDPGVFAVSAAGTGALACLGTNFTIAVNDPTTGQVTFTPSSTVTLAQGATCRINFAVDVSQAPADDSKPAVGLQTLQIGRVSGTQTGGELSGTGLGTDETTVALASPSLSTIPGAGGVVGVVLNDTATLTGGSNPTGSVTFTLYPPSDATCTGPASYTDVDATAPYATSPGFVSNAAGVWHWAAAYSGDANNNATTSPCSAEPVTVLPPLGHIIVDKITDPSGDPQSFSFDATGGSYADFGLTDAATPNDQELAAGIYSVSETVPAGWDQTSATCVSSTADVETPASISLQDGETVTCTFTNTKRGTLIVDKVTVPGGSTDVFSITASGSGTITGGGAGTITDALNQSYEVTPGTYSVVEAALPGWTETSNTCSGVTVAAGGTATCTITNTEIVEVAEYCSPGYWKQSQHFDSWLGYAPTDLFSTVFGESVSILWSAKGKPAAVANPTLLQVLEANGGGISSAARAAVGALLNASALDSGLTTAEVISMFQDANPDGDLEALKAGYTAPENCPLN